MIPESSSPPQGTQTHPNASLLPFPNHGKSQRHHGAGQGERTEGSPTHSLLIPGRFSALPVMPRWQVDNQRRCLCSCIPRTEPNSLPEPGARPSSGSGMGNKGAFIGAQWAAQSRAGAAAGTRPRPWQPKERPRLERDSKVGQNCAGKHGESLSK